MIAEFSYICAFLFLSMLILQLFLCAYKTPWVFSFFFLVIFIVRLDSFMTTSVACVVGPNVTTSSIDFPFQNLIVFGEVI